MQTFTGILEQGLLGDVLVGLNRRGQALLSSVVSSVVVDEIHGQWIRRLSKLSKYLLKDKTHLTEYVQQVVWNREWFYFIALKDDSGTPVAASLWLDGELGNYNTSFTQNNLFSTEVAGNQFSTGDVPPQAGERIDPPDENC